MTETTEGVPGPYVELCPDCEGRGDDGDPMWPHVCPTCRGECFVGEGPDWEPFMPPGNWDDE